MSEHFSRNREDSENAASIVGFLCSTERNNGEASGTEDGRSFRIPSALQVQRSKSLEAKEPRTARDEAGTEENSGKRQSIPRTGTAGI